MSDYMPKWKGTMQYNDALEILSSVLIYNIIAINSISIKGGK